MRRALAALGVLVILVLCPTWAEVERPESSLFVFPEHFDKDSLLFTFVQVTDTHIVSGKPVDSIKRAIEDINLLKPKPKFVVVTGDLIDGAEPKESTELYKKLFSELRCPFFSVFGNHDNRQAYKEILAEFNYSFDLPPYHFIVLDNIDMSAKDTYGGKFSEGTITWLKEHLQAVSKKMPIILFCHATIFREPSYSKKLPGDAYNYQPVLEMLKPYNVVAWFAGHAHCNAYVRKDGVDYFTAGCLSDNRGNSNCPLGYRIIKVYKDRVESTYRSITDFTSRIVVAQDGSGQFNGNDQTPLLEAVKKASKTGGTIFIKPGEYLIRKQIDLKSGITVIGTAQTVLKLPSPTLTTAAAEKGQESLLVENSFELATDTSIQICPPAGQKTFPDGDKKSFTARIKAVEKGKILLAEPLPCPVPEKSRVGYRNNVFFVGGSRKDITIENLVIDGGRRKDIPMPGHIFRCAILAHGNWTYGGGPTAPPIENLQVVNCHIRNCYGRAVAMYWVVRGKVEGCFIENIADEAIDFDHFCYYCMAIGNEVNNSATGVTINDGSYCTVEYNRFSDCGVAVNIWWWYMCPQKDIDIGNKIRHNFISQTPHGNLCRQKMLLERSKRQLR